MAVILKKGSTSDPIPVQQTVLAERKQETQGEPQDLLPVEEEDKFNLLAKSYNLN